MLFLTRKLHLHVMWICSSFQPFLDTEGLAITVRSQCSDVVHAGQALEAQCPEGGDNYGDAPGLDRSDIPSLLISILGWGRFLSIPGSNSGWRRACLFKWSLRIKRFSQIGHENFFSPKRIKENHTIINNSNAKEKHATK